MRWPWLAIQVFFKGGSSTEKVSIDYPIGHRKRREEGIPVLVEKFENAIGDLFDSDQAKKIVAACEDQERLESMQMADFAKLWVKS